MEIQQLTSDDIDMGATVHLGGITYSLCSFTVFCFTKEVTLCSKCIFNRNIGKESHDELRNSTPERVIEEIQIIAILS